MSTREIAESLMAELSNMHAILHWEVTPVTRGGGVNLRLISHPGCFDMRSVAHVTP